LPTLADGITERQFALALEFAMRERGASGNSFDPIIASGPNGSRPHHMPSDRIIERNELIVCDFGCIVDGYCSDMTRTVSVVDPGVYLAGIGGVRIEDTVVVSAGGAEPLTLTPKDLVPKDFM